MLTPHISVVQVPVKAIGKKRSRVFFFPKLSLSLICFGPSAVLVGRVKSGALVPVVSAINESLVQVKRNFTIRSRRSGSKILRAKPLRQRPQIYTDATQMTEGKD